jgi:hypothetical protein
MMQHRLVGFFCFNDHQSFDKDFTIDDFDIEQCESLIQFNLEHKEGEPACLMLSIERPKGKKKMMSIGHKGVLFVTNEMGKREIIFYGCVSNIVFSDHALISVRLDSCFPENLSKEKKEIIDEIKKQDGWNELVDDQTLDSALGLFSLCPYWDRTTARMSTSHAVQSKKKEYDLTNWVRADSLKIREKPPLSFVEVEISAQWLQQWSQYQDIFPVIQGKFSDKRIATYTGASLLSSWPKSGSIRHSGYQIMHSQIWEKEPLMFDQKFFLKNDKVIKKFYFDGQIIVGRRYKQKRKERVFFSLRSGAADSYANGKKMTLNLGCLVSEKLMEIDFFSVMKTYRKNDKVRYGASVYSFVHDEKFVESFQDSDWLLLENDSKKMSMSVRDSFFLDKETQDFTPEGLSVFNNALQRAESLLLWGGRSIEISATVPFWPCYSLTLDHVACVWDSVNAIQRHGKVSYLNMKGGKNGYWIDVLIRALPDRFQTEKRMYSQGRLGTKNQRQQVPYKIHPVEEPLFPRESMINQLLCTEECVSVINDPKDQEKIIGLNADTGLSRGDGTSIRISFPCIKTRPCLERKIEMDILSVYDLHNNHENNE